MTTIFLEQFGYPEHTLTAAEIIAELQTLPADTPILVKYEGCTGGITGPIICGLDASTYVDANDAPVTVAIIDVELY